MKVSPYDTKPCASYNMADTLKHLRLAFVEGTLYSLEGTSLNGIYLVSPRNREIKPFTHPVLIEHAGQTVVVIDARALIREDGSTYKVANHTEFQFNVTRAALTLYAHRHSMEDIGNLGDLALTTFARYVSENITRRLNLNPEEQMKLAMVASFWHLCGMRELTELTESDLQRMVPRVARCTKLNAQWIFDNIGPIRYMDGVVDFVAVVKEVIPNRRLEQLDVALLYAMLGGGWFGFNAREVVAVALEHIPTWYAIIYTALIDRSFRKAPIANVVQINDRNGAGKQFTINLARMLEVL